MAVIGVSLIPVSAGLRQNFSESINNQSNSHGTGDYRFNTQCTLGSRN